MSLRGTDVLEYLLEELGVTELPHGPIRQFSRLREKLAQLESDGTRVVIVIEDAIRLGAESLAELEALTAADAGESGGAALVVMGDARLVEFLPDPQLTRLTQRMQHSVQIRPMSEPELRGYLLHCIREAGGEFEQVLAPDAAAAIRGLSQGIPRVANKIVEAALSAAAATGARPVSADLVTDVAGREFGLKAPPQPVAAPAAEPVPAPAVDVDTQPVPEPVPEPAVDTAPEPAPAEEPECEPEPLVEATLEPASEPDNETPGEPEEPVIVFSDEAPGEHDDGIPELIQDTLPDLEILATEIAGIEPMQEPGPLVEPQDLDDVIASVSEPGPIDDPAPELSELPESPELPELQPDTPAVIDSSPAEVPEWDKDPTLAELVPDLDALEKAMSVAQGEGDNDAPPVEEEMPVLQPEPETKASEEIPEITLDNAIEQRIGDQRIDEPGAVSASRDGDGGAAHSEGNGPEVKLPPRKAKQADAELERIASELARAKTLEDVDDKLAETLFGEEISLAAAEVAARVQAEQSANDEELSLFDTNAAQMAQAVGSPVVDGIAEEGYEVELAAESGNVFGGPDLSASQRLNTVRSLNTGETGTVPVQADAAGRADSSVDRQKPDPIEDQINTSMTQTLKALDVRPPVLDRTTRFDDDDQDDDEDLSEEKEKKGGFFSRFRRS